MKNLGIKNNQDIKDSSIASLLWNDEQFFKRERLCGGFAAAQPYSYSLRVVIPNIVRNLINDRLFNPVITFLMCVLLISGCNRSNDEVLCIQLDPLKKVFKEELYFEENRDTADIAKGETASFQFVLRSMYPIQNLKIEAGDLVNGDQRIVATLKAFVGYIRAGRNSDQPSKDSFRPLSDLYPDCLQETETIDVTALSNQPVWIAHYVPRDASAGIYSANLSFSGTINGRPFKIQKQVHTKVYGVVLPEQTLYVTNWFSTDFSKMNNDTAVEFDSDRYWELFKELANSMRNHGQNTYMISLKNCKSELSENKHYSFDFTNFDKVVEFLIREGGLQRIEGAHLGNRMGDWESDFGIHVPEVGLRSIDNDTTRNYLTQFIPALFNHLKNKGWEKMYMQHIADEPVDENAESYIRIAEFLKKQEPEIKLIDAVMSRKLADVINVWVPRLDHYHHDYAYFCQRQAAGDEVWFYTCVFPQDNYANRFMEQPLVQMRILHWLNYHYGATGYLHWAFNWWHRMDMTGDAAIRSGFNNDVWPAGDCWISYPAYGKVFSSIRLAAMRDGIADYELLKLLEQKSPDKANHLARKIIINFDRYDNSISNFRKLRRQLLIWLSE